MPLRTGERAGERQRIVLYLVTTVTTLCSMKTVITIDRGEQKNKSSIY